MKFCPNCGIRKKQKHLNSKWCKPCADGFRKQPKPNLNIWQKREALRLRGKIPKEEIAVRIGASRSSVMRLGRDLNLSFAALLRYKTNPALVKDVCQYYEQHGKRKTQLRFPQVNVRSIVERYRWFAPRQERWTDEQLRELARMAGLISKESQAIYFKRPRANKGSITSVWMKTFRQGGGSVNGLSWHLARHFVDQEYRPIQTSVWAQRDRKSSINLGRKVVSWVDFEKHLIPSAPDWLKECATAMAKFQRWLHGTDHVGKKIKMLIKEREKKCLS
jgi:hypothetical protein